MGKGPGSEKGAAEDGGATSGEEEGRHTHGVADSLESLESYSGQHNVVEHSPHGRYVRFNVKIGTGAYKEMWKAYDTSEGVEVSWNTLSLKMIPPQDKRRVISELKILEELDHPNIIDFYTSWYNREQKQIVFITELISSGSLMDFVKPITLRWKIFKKWAVQILQGLGFLHGRKPPIIHRNLNCSNIFILGHRGQLKIGDLGLSTASHNKSENVVGNPHFMAPELFEDDYDEKVDIYAFGMCILQIITKEVPYSECHSIGEVCRRVMAHVPPAALSRIQHENAAKFIEICLQADPKKRPSAEALLQHPFLQENKEEDASEVILGPRVEVPFDRGDSGGAEGGVPPSRSRASSRNLCDPFMGSDPANAPTKSLGTVIGPDGTKLHMRFFSEPHGSYSEYSDDESDIEGLFELPHHILADMPRDDSCIGLRSRGASAASVESIDDIRSITRMRSVNSMGSLISQSTVASRSPRSAWNREDDRNEDDELLSKLPAAENTCKKVKVMGGRNAELVEDDVPSKEKGGASAGTIEPNVPSRERTPEPFIPGQAVGKENGGVEGGQLQENVVEEHHRGSMDEGRRGSLGPEPIKEEEGEDEEEERSSSDSLSRQSVTSKGKEPGTDAATDNLLAISSLPSYDISVLSSSSSSSFSVSSTASDSPPVSPAKSSSITPPESPASVSRAETEKRDVRADSNSFVVRIDGTDDGGLRTRIASSSSLQSDYSCILDSSEGLEMEQMPPLPLQPPPPPPSSTAHGATTTSTITTTTTSTRGSKQSIMTLIIKTPVEGMLKEIQFDFNLELDDPLAVAKEMVMELGIPETDMPGIAKTIMLLKEKEQARRLAKQRRRRDGGEGEPAAVMSSAARKISAGGLSVSVPGPPEVTRRPSSERTTGPSPNGQQPTTPGAASRRAALNRGGGGGGGSTNALVHHRTASGARLQRLPSEKQIIHHVTPGHLAAVGHTLSQQTQLPHQQGPSSAPAGTTCTTTSIGLIPRGYSMENLPGSRRPSAASSTSNPADEDMVELLTTVESDESMDEEEEKDGELQKKRQEHVKVVQRARKAFAARMESMVKHREDKDRSHRELLEQLEKEISECDRRVYMAEEDQQRRLKEMEDAWRAIEERHRQLVRLKQLQKQQQPQQAQQH